jgi:hypothetical protein
MDAVPSDSYLVMAHAASDIAPEASAEMARLYNGMSSVPITPRNREQVARFFDGLDMTPPGLVPISQWGLAGRIDATVSGLVASSSSSSSFFVVQNSSRLRRLPVSAGHRKCSRLSG